MWRLMGQLVLVAVAVAVLAGPAHGGGGGHAVEVVRCSRGFTNVYALVGEGGVVLVDAHYPGAEVWLSRCLSRSGVLGADLSLVVLTHGHADHAGSGAALQAWGVPVAVGSGDVPMVQAGDHGAPHPTDWRGALLLPHLDPVYPPFSPDIVVVDVLDLSPYGIGGEARVMGGHSAGSLVVTLSDGRVVSGDLIRGQMVLRRRPTLHFFHEDLDRAHANLGVLLGAGATELLVAHGKPLSARRVSRWLRRHPRA